MVRSLARLFFAGLLAAFLAALHGCSGALPPFTIGLDGTVSPSPTVSLYVTSGGRVPPAQLSPPTPLTVAAGGTLNILNAPQGTSATAPVTPQRSP